MYGAQQRVLLRKSRVSDLEVDTGNRRKELRVSQKNKQQEYAQDMDFSRKNYEFYQSQDENYLTMNRGRSYQPYYPPKHYNDSDAGTFYMTDKAPRTYQRAVAEDPAMYHNIHYEQEHYEHKNPEEFQASNRQQYYHDQESVDYSRKNYEYYYDPNFEMKNNVHHAHEHYDIAPRDPYYSDKAIYYGNQAPDDFSRKGQEFYHDPECYMDNNVHHYKHEQPQKQNAQDSDPRFFYEAADVAYKQDLRASQLNSPNVLKFDYQTYNSDANSYPGEMRRSISGQPSVVPLPPVRKCGMKHDNPVFAEQSERICLYKKRHGEL